MSYTFFVLPKDFTKMRGEIFTRMQEEGLLNACMHSFDNPTKQDWLKITAPHKGWLLCCAPKNTGTHTAANLCGVAWLEPWRGQVWTLDFTVFRAHFAEFAAMSRATLEWIFTHAPCQSIVGLCAKSNAHAWRLAPKTDFKILGKIPGACLRAKRNIYEDGILGLATKEDVLNNVKASQAHAQSK